MAEPTTGELMQTLLDFQSGLMGYLDKRFTQIDNRFEQIDRRFEQVEFRLDKLERKFVALDALRLRITANAATLLRMTPQQQ